MISLQQLLGKEDRFFDLFDQSAAECVESVRALDGAAKNPADPAPFQAFAKARHSDKNIHNQINAALCFEPVTSLERSDIVTLSNALYKIPKTVEKIGERLRLAPGFLEGFDLPGQVTMLDQATSTLAAMVKGLRTRKSIEDVREMNSRLQQIEGEADAQVLKLLTQLYSGEMEGRRVVFLKDLFELIEKVTDRCRDAGNAIVTILLKST